MTSYFENRMNNPQEFADDYMFDALAILVKALEYEEDSSTFFEISEENTSKKNADMYWAMSMETSQRAYGLIDAYNIITNREVVCARCAIRNEIDFVKEAIRVKDGFVF